MYPAISRLFLNGFSIRKLKGIGKELWGKGDSDQTVSDVAGFLDKEFQRLRGKPIEATAEFLGGICQQVGRSASRKG